jgi:mitogen-activated protein kinase kinase kinase 6
VEKKAVSPKSEELSKEGVSQQKQQETPIPQSPLPGELEQGPPPLIVQLGLLRAETDR